MAEKNWTPEQLSAIEERKRTLLVSAAAGSGKTATLTERIIRSLLDEENTADISRMIVVTFTRAAASELRERISSALERAIAENPKDRRLERQLLLLPNAKICTIDSFCSDIVRQNASKIGVSPAFRVCDENERALLMNEIIEGLIEECYSSTDGSICDGKDFCEFADNLVSVRSEGDLGKILLSMYNSLEAFIDKIDAIKQIRDNFLPKNDFFESVAGEAIKDDIAKTFSYYESLYKKYIDEIKASGNDAVIKKHLPSYEYDYTYIKRILSKKDLRYVEARENFLNYNKVNLLSLKKEESDIFDEKARAVKEKFSEAQKAIASAYFSYDEKRITELQTKLYTFHSVLHLLLAEFEKRFCAEKIKRGICDYGDLEHYALALLYDRDGISDIAKKIRDYYEYVYIDEYQDVNPVQHKIFEAIRRDDNCFMVGDIKQSIYSFRRAEPDIFASMKKSFPKLAEAGESKSASVFMSNNFRCDEEIVNFTNLIFDTLFGFAGESIGYEEGDKLVFSKQGDRKGEATLPTVAIIDRSKSFDAAMKEALDEESENDDDEKRVEAEYVANKIEELLGDTLDNGEKIKPSDIAILLRSFTKAGKYAEALKKRGIPVSQKSDDDFFTSPEILLALCLLNAVDNPQRDVWLMGLLHSPLYDFSFDELTLIKLEGGDELSLYDCLCLYAKNHPDFEKGSFFLSELDKFRRKARSCAVDRLISYLYKETGILSLYGRGAEKGHSKLLYLYNYARSFEASSFKGLYNFICYINQIIENEKSIVDTTAKAGAEGVKIMTIHGSKGLEFPVCFVCECGRELRPQEIQNELVFDARLGFSPKFLETENYLRADNPVRQAIVNSIKIKNQQEELRILYVALTRARERLYITGSSRAYADNFVYECKMKGESMAEYSVLHSGSYLEWIFSSIMNKKQSLASVKRVTSVLDSIEEEDITGEILSGARISRAVSLDISVGQENAESSEEATLNEADENDIEDNEDKNGQKIKEIKEELERRFSFEYPYSHMSEFPAKLSVSRLYPSLLDAKSEEEISLSDIIESQKEKAQGEREESEQDERRASKKVIPDFLQKREITPAQRGTATHLFMQFADFSLVKKNGARAELMRLVNEGFISQSDADIAFIDELERFEASDFIREILSADRVRREFRFNTLFPAEMFAIDEENKEKLSGETLLVQGVIDCILEYNDGSYSLIDYKTDRLNGYELANPREAEKKLSERHREQLTYYAFACEKMYGAPPREVKIYSLPLGKTVSVKLK